jgi:hypothetical protein
MLKKSYNNSLNFIANKKIFEKIMQTTFFKKMIFTANPCKIDFSHFSKNKVIGPFSKLDIFKMSIFGKPLLLYFWTFLLFL